jgi:hypothetical protein
MTNDSGITGWLAEVSDIGSAIAELAPHIYWVAVLASFLVLAIFRRRVRRSLEEKQSRPEGQQSPPSMIAIGPEANGKPIASDSPVASLPGTSSSDSRWRTLSTDARLHRARLAKLYVVAGLGLALALATVNTVATVNQSGAPLLRFLHAVICFSTPLILVARVVLGRWTPRLVRVSVLVALLTVIAQALPSASEETGTAIVFTAALALLLHQSIRAMGSLAVGFFTVVFLGTAIAVVTALHLWQAELRANPQTAVVREAIRNMDPAQQFEALISRAQEVVPIILQRVGVGTVVGLPVSVLLAGLLLLVVTTAYARKRTSDQWLLIASIWLFFAVAVAPRQSLGGLAANLACWAVFVFLVRFVWSRLRRSESPCVRLLLLRSFSLGERSHRLFQEFETLWRGVGSVQLVGATDLAVATLEPHELLDFITGRSGRYFTHTPTDVDHRLTSFDYRRDPDGRFRVNEVFCSGDATWQHAVRRLLAEADCVLMDVRGFNRYRAGCVFEIRCLAESAAPRRMVFLVDQATDRNFIAEIWTDASGGLSIAPAEETAALAFVPEHQGDDGACERIIAGYSKQSV